jgi:hypothetical protein
MVAGQRSDLWHPSRAGRLGVAGQGLYENIYGHCPATSVVAAGLVCALPGSAGFLVLLDAPVNAPASFVRVSPFSPPREPPANRLDRNEFSPLGGCEWRNSRSGTGISAALAYQRSSGLASDHDHYGDNKPHGVGIAATIPSE